MIRGTIRFRGYAEVIGAFLDLGLLETNIKIDQKMCIIQLLEEKIKDQPEKLKNISKNELKKAISLVPDLMINLNIFKFVNKVTENENWVLMSPEQRIDRIRIILDGFNHLKLFHKGTFLNPHETILKSLVEHLEKYLQLQEKDQDFIIMIIEIEAIFENTMEKKYKF